MFFARFWGKRMFCCLNTHNFDIAYANKLLLFFSINNSQSVYAMDLEKLWAYKSSLKRLTSLEFDSYNFKVYNFLHFRIICLLITANPITSIYN